MLVGMKHRLHYLTTAHRIFQQNSHVLRSITAQLTPGSLQECHVEKSVWKLAKETCMTHPCDLLSECAVQRCQHSCGITLPALQFLCLCPGSCLSSCYLHHMDTMQADPTRYLLCFQSHPTRYMLNNMCLLLEARATLAASDSLSVSLYVTQANVLSAGT